MESPKKIAHEIGGVKRDALRFGLNGVKSDIVGSHPLESSYESGKRSHEATKRTIIGHTYGSALPLKMDMDRQILSRMITVCITGYLSALPRTRFTLETIYVCTGEYIGFQRPPGPIPSSMLGLEVYTGAIDNFGFEDYLNDPRDSETFKPVDFHHGMEVRLGISKGPVASSFM
ncbi:hypothetical protein F2Q69_00020089 [Brassica cretica]|uniref:Uncharacterized protein n=1 Tax=Brassica cretica TaxID=69181 RepID=A0A8S9Q254_BRACR|nr:hypothetical protein F2Q69_00020089 [Brassica cretica]